MINKSEADKLLLLAEQGITKAMYLAGEMYLLGGAYPIDKKKAEAWFLKAAGKGNLEALMQLAIMNGNGIPSNPAKAFSFCKQAAEKGHVFAQALLGSLYLDGIGVQKDQKEAIVWYLKAADAGHPEGLYNLGTIYAGENDFKKAFECYEKASRQGYSRATTNLATCYSLGKGVERDLKKAIELYELSSSRGDFVASFSLGAIYITAALGMFNPYKAYALIYEAVLAGLPQAKMFLQQIPMPLSPGEKKEAEAVAKKEFMKKRNDLEKDSLESISKGVGSDFSFADMVPDESDIKNN